MKISDIVPSPTNPRIAILPYDDEYKQIENSFNRFGYVEPLVVNSVNNHCVSGNNRLSVLKDLGVNEILCVIIEEHDESREIALTIALNKIKGKWDYDKLGDLLSCVNDEDLEVTGFYADEFEKLLNEIEDYIPEDKTDNNSKCDCKQFETTINAKIGSYSFKINKSDYINMINEIRIEKGFDNKVIIEELKRRLKKK